MITLNRKKKLEKNENEQFKLEKEIFYVISILFKKKISF